MPAATTTKNEAREARARSPLVWSGALATAHLVRGTNGVSARLRVRYSDLAQVGPVAKPIAAYVPARGLTAPCWTARSISALDAARGSSNPRPSKGGTRSATKTEVVFGPSGTTHDSRTAHDVVPTAPPHVRDGEGRIRETLRGDEQLGAERRRIRRCRNTRRVGPGDRGVIERDAPGRKHRQRLAHRDRRARVGRALREHCEALRRGREFCIEHRHEPRQR